MVRRPGPSLARSASSMTAFSWAASVPGNASRALDRRLWRTPSCRRPVNSSVVARGSPRARSRSAARARCPASGRRQPPHRPRRDVADRLPGLPRDSDRRNVRDEQRDVVGALAQRRHRDREDGQAVVEILAELPARHLCRAGRGSSRRRRARRPDRSRSRPRARTRAPAARAAASTCISSGSSPTSSRNSVPPWASSNRPLAPLRRAGERPLLVTEQLLSINRAESRRSSPSRRLAPPAPPRGSRARSAPCPCRSRRR